MFFVEARYHRKPDKVPQQIHYISHREERLQGGERRELFGIGDRYRALRGDEKAIQRAFAEDAKGLRRPVHFRFILTVDNRTAERFARLDGTATERVVRDAVQHTFGEGGTSMRRELPGLLVLPRGSYVRLEHALAVCEEIEAIQEELAAERSNRAS